MGMQEIAHLVQLVTTIISHTLNQALDAKLLSQHASPSWCTQNHGFLFISILEILREKVFFGTKERMDQD